MIKVGSRVRLFWGTQELGYEYDMYGIAFLLIPNIYYGMIFVGVSRHVLDVVKDKSI